MNAILRSAIAVVLVASPPSAQQRNVAQKLGYPANAKLLILHADDLGVAHSVNAASLEALSKGAISSASFMIPTPWISEVAAYARANPMPTSEFISHSRASGTRTGGEAT